LEVQTPYAHMANNGQQMGSSCNENKIPKLVFYILKTYLFKCDDIDKGHIIFKEIQVFNLKINSSTFILVIKIEGKNLLMLKGKW
jgi:hypothetical protein